MSSLGKVAMSSSLAVTDKVRDCSSDPLHISEILPSVLAKYGIYETQTPSRVEGRSSTIMPSHCVSASAIGFATSTGVASHF